MCYRYCSNLFRNIRKESEFRQYHCRNSTKVEETKRKSGREKFFIFDNTITIIPSAHTYCPYMLPEWVLEVWVRARKTKCGNGIAEIGKKILAIVAMPLPKMKKKKKGYKICEREKKNCHIHNIFTTNHMWLIIISSKKLLYV